MLVGSGRRSGRRYRHDGYRRGLNHDDRGGGGRGSDRLTAMTFGALIDAVGFRVPNDHASKQDSYAQ